jgi:hypothetical protein
MSFMQMGDIQTYYELHGDPCPLEYLSMEPEHLMKCGVLLESCSLTILAFV